jgi:TetR/AcrR family tetracycline transcriptional repressor
MQTTLNRAPRLDRHQVIRVALRLLDDVGLDGLTLRHLAAELGVQAPALYWHFANKQDLLDHVAHAMTEPWLKAVPASGVGRRWDEWLTEVGRSYRTLLLSHRDGARLVASTRPLPDSLPLLDSCIAMFQASTSCSAGQALQCLTTITTYVRGFVLDEYAELLRSQAQPDGADAQGTTIPDRAPLRAPRLDAAIEEIGSPSGEGAFEYGLRIIVDGIRSIVATHRA